MKPHLKQNYKEINDVFGLPQEYKKIKLYPIKLKDSSYQDLLYQLFGHPKNYIANREILRTSYLKFLLYVVSGNAESTPEIYMEFVREFLSHITKVEKENILWKWKENNAEGLEAVSFQIVLNGIELEEHDIDNIREIVLEQNASGIKYIEDFNPDLEKSLAIANGNSSDISLTDEIFTLCALLKLSIKEVEEYTFFQFRSILEKTLVLKEYDMYKPLIASGEVTLKNGELKHFFYHSKRGGGRYDSILVSKEEYEKSDAFKATLNS